MEGLYSKYHTLLFSIAYRMLGTVSDAEDIVQDVFLRVTERKLENVDNEKAYLCKMVTNSCIDYLKSAYKKREVYIGPWLPEPLVVGESDPLYEVVKGERISTAVILLFENLNPIERAVFVLREVLKYEYAAIAEIVNRNETSCRKIQSRAKKKFPLDQENKPLNHEKEAVIQPFIAAVLEGNLKQVENLLSEEVTLYSDGGGKVYAAIKPVHSRKFVLRFIAALLKENTNEDNEQPTIKVVNVNGSIGILAIGTDKIKNVISFNVSNNKIQDIYIVRNPDKLNHIS